MPANAGTHAQPLYQNMIIGPVPSHDQPQHPSFVGLYLVLYRTVHGTLFVYSSVPLYEVAYNDIQ